MEKKLNHSRPVAFGDRMKEKEELFNKYLYKPKKATSRFKDKKERVSRLKFLEAQAEINNKLLKLNLND